MRQGNEMKNEFVGSHTARYLLMGNKRLVMATVVNNAQLTKKFNKNKRQIETTKDKE